LLTAEAFRALEQVLLEELGVVVNV